MAADAPSWADYRALAHRVCALAEGREAAGEQPCAELMRAMQHYVDNFGRVRLPVVLPVGAIEEAWWSTPKVVPHVGARGISRQTDPHQPRSKPR